MKKFIFADQTEKTKEPLFNIKYCARCCMPETEEEYTEDEYGMCRICRSSEQKMHIDWVKRREMFEDIRDKCKAQAGNSYDCMVPISGGKDSAFQLYVLTQVFKMKPLAVTYSHNWFSKTGWYNLVNTLKEFNVDHLIYTPNRNLVNRIARKSLGMIGDACWSCHAGVGSIPLHIASKYNIPVIIYGESAAEATQRGDYFENNFDYDKHYYTKFSAKKTPDEMLCSSLNSKDLHMYQLPSDQEVEDAQIRILHLGDFIFWDEERQVEFMRDYYGWRETDIENDYKGYQSAECIMPGVHDFTCYLKRGWGKTSVHASQDVRSGILTREEGFELINKTDMQRPDVLDYYLNITELNEEDFYKEISKHKEPSLKNQKIPIIPKQTKHKERLIPFAEQLAAKHKDSKVQQEIELSRTCISCGLELKNHSLLCFACNDLQLIDETRFNKINKFRNFAEILTRKSGDNFDCLIPVDNTWQCVYMLHLVKSIYKLKPLVVTFDQFSFSTIGFSNIINVLETFNVDQMMFTPSAELSDKLRKESKKIFSDDDDLHRLGLYNFMIKTALEFDINTIIDCNKFLSSISTNQGPKDTIHNEIDFKELEKLTDKATSSNLSLRDIHLFSSNSFNVKDLRVLKYVPLENLFEFNDDAKSFTEKYYGWKEDELNDHSSYVDGFIKENKPELSSVYINNDNFYKLPIAECNNDLSSMSAKSMVYGLNNNDFSPVDIAKSVIEKFESYDKYVNAWESFDPQKILELAEHSEKNIHNNERKRILEGVPVGIKDIFNTIDYPTQMGSQLWSDFTPGNDARAVFNIKKFGALVFGKTVTSEFAVHALNKTVNPHNKDRTPGTSSSGSAVAIATGMVPVTIGTQSAGSIIRPASFCGIYGFKPSFGMIPRTGILKTTDTLDSVGFFVRHAEDIENVFNSIRLHGSNYPMIQKGVKNSKERLIKKDRNWKIGFVKTHTWNESERYAQNALINWINNLSNLDDFDVKEVELPISMGNSHEIHNIIYDHCLAYYFREEFKTKEGMTKRLKDQIANGKDVTVEEYQLALKKQILLGEEMDQFLSQYDAIISLSTAGEAPILGGIESHDPSLMWTLTGLPALNVPAFLSPTAMPFGLQIAARRYSDLIIIEIVNKLVECEMIPSTNYPLVDLDKVISRMS